MFPRHVPTGAAAVLAALALPAAAHAGTKTVYAGPPASKARALPANATGNAFYPRRIAVNAGGKVAFKIGGLHNVSFPARGRQAPPFHAPDPARPVSGAKDPAGADLWFNGQPGWFLNMAAIAPSGDKVVDGKALDGSGIFQGQGAPPDYVVSFPKPGAYRYVCSVHPGMKGTVKVLPKRAKAPSEARDAKAVRRQLAATVALAKRLAKARPAGAVVRAGSDHKEVAFFSFFPGVRHVKAGQTVRFEMSKDTTEVHNVVFGPAGFLADQAAAFISIGAQGVGYNPLAVYPSDPGALSADGTSHGNGYLGTGLLDADPRTSLPRARSVTFTRPGSYGFICTVHGPSMKGTIEVS